jgi:molybdate transport system ATP-binding protein
MISVDIEQQLGDFRLDVKFSAEAPYRRPLRPLRLGQDQCRQRDRWNRQASARFDRVNEEILYDAAERIDLPPNERRVGYVFQDSLLFPHMDVESNLRYGQRLRSPEIASSTRRASSTCSGSRRCCSGSRALCPAARGSVSPSAARCSRSRASC